MAQDSIDKQTSNSAPTETTETVSQQRFPLTSLNFLLMAIAGVMIVAGFLLMLGPGSSPENGFNPDIFSTRRIVVGPIISFLGFLFMGFGIIFKSKKG